MKYIDFQNKVTEYIQSVSLKNAIREKGTLFSPIELCKIICEYIEKYDDRICLLREMTEVVSDELTKNYIHYQIKDFEIQLKNFLQSSDNCVYELHIKETPDSYEERYLCDSYNSALDMIDKFYDEYDDGENEESRYEIVKRKIFRSEKNSFREDFSGSVTLNFKREICFIFGEGFQETFYECQGDCWECDRMCIININIGFPAFIDFKDLVKYKDRCGKVKFGVNWDSPENQAEEAVVIPLDCYALRYGCFEKGFDYHEHIPFTYIEKAEADELSEEYRIIYDGYLKYLNEKERA